MVSHIFTCLCKHVSVRLFICATSDTCIKVLLCACGEIGLVIAWKLLRWASEIPPSEFVDSSEDIDFASTSESGGTGLLSALDIYRLYHQQVSGSGLHRHTRSLQIGVRP